MDSEVKRLGLAVVDERWPDGALVFSFLWPMDAPPLPEDARGVMVDPPRVYDSTLTMGETGWKASSFEEPVISVGKRLNRQLTRSLRTIATVPLFAVSADGSARSKRPAAWGTADVVNSGLTLRQFRYGAVTFQA